MKNTSRALLAVFTATVWISLNEFVRNQFLLKAKWVDLYQSMQQTFPETPLNGAVWGIWALIFSLLIYLISRKFSLLQTTLIAWVAGFMMMWLVIGNLNVLPMDILPVAVPWSMIEALGAAWLVKKWGSAD